MEFADRVKNLKPSPTLALAAQAKALIEEGKDIISLTVGEPDWPTVEEAVQAGIMAIHEGKTKYTPAGGTPDLKKAILEQFNRDYKKNYEISQVAVATGAKYSLFAAFQCLLNPGDEVIIPSPYWVSYPDMIELCGAQFQTISFEGIAQDSHLQSQFENLFNERTHLVLLNSPNNPSGDYLNFEDLDFIGQVLKKYPSVAIISDDIYSYLTLDQKERAPHILDVHEDLAERTLCISGASKSYSMTGWRVGWALGPGKWIQMISDFQSQSTGCPCSISQEAATAAIRSASQNIPDIQTLLVKRQKMFTKLLSEVPNIHFKLPRGAFYLWLDISYYLKRNSWTSDQFSQHLLDSQGLIVVPGSAFGQDQFIRLSFAVDEKTIQKSVERLQIFISSL